MKAFKPTQNRTSLISNEVLETHRYRLSLNAQKLLYGLAQSIDHTIDMFGELQVDIQGIFNFLEIENRRDKYTLVYNAFNEIATNPLNLYVSEKNWKLIPWATIGFNENKSSFVTVKFTEDAKPFLLHLNGYVKIQGKYICSLSSTYATWLYPVMKMVLNKYYGQHIITIQRLKEYTFTENPKEHPSYNTSKNAISDFLRRVLGISKNKKSKKHEIIESSPLWEINEKTDITITVEVLKTGRKYDKVCFYVQSKNKKTDKSNVDKSTFVNEIPKTTGLNPVSRMPLKDVYEYAKASKMNVHDYCKTAGYYIQGQYVYKQFNTPKKGKKSTGQMSIKGIIDEQVK